MNENDRNAMTENNIEFLAGNHIIGNYVITIDAKDEFVNVFDRYDDGHLETWAAVEIPFADLKKFAGTLMQIESLLFTYGIIKD